MRIAQRIGERAGFREFGPTGAIVGVGPRGAEMSP